MLGEAIESVQAQTLRPSIHAIGIDHERVGIGRMLNQLAAGVEAEWLARLDDDDLFKPCHLEVLAAACDDADVVYTWCDVAARTRNGTAPPLPSVLGPAGWIPNQAFDAPKLRERNYIPATSLIRKTLWQELGGWSLPGWGVGESPARAGVGRGLELLAQGTRCGCTVRLHPGSHMDVPLPRRQPCGSSNSRDPTGKALVLPSRAALTTRADSIAVGAALAHRIGYGGHAWALLQYALGFRALGWEVTVIDRLEPGMLGGAGEGAALDYVRRLLGENGLGASYGVLGADGESLGGLTREELLARTRQARFLLNIMGFVRDPELLEAARRRVFLDIDPGFGQIWRELGLADVFAGHDDFVTVGRNVGRAGCEVPTVRPPLADASPPGRARAVPGGRPGARTSPVSAAGGAPMTASNTVASASACARTSSGSSRGCRFWSRRPSGWPSRSIASDQRDITLLEDSGWQLVDPREAASDPAAYLRFVQGSLAEFTVAKEAYVTLRTGWLGDRTALYLASGKPALVEDTGLAGHYPLGEGLLAFSTLEDAVAGAQQIIGDYATHARAARRLAEREFDARLVLTRLLEELG